MYTLNFNTSTKTVLVESDNDNFSFENVHTVKVETNYYEVIQKNLEDQKTRPVLRIPICSTLMIIKH